MPRPASIDLWFPLHDVSVVAEHAMAATDHSRCPYADDTTPTAPSLIWTKNDGTYLWSNAIPRQPRNPSVPDSDPMVVHALCWGPGTGPAIGSTPVGGDDFHEYIDLTETYTGGHTLIGLIREYTADNAWLIITAMPGRFEISLTTATPRAASRRPRTSTR
ncbi:hypothetical protein [Nocardia carnea]|uniref:hypothetical protein n=1 Tax=Nocardia carnea TaxID=37328 RepID=UPI00245608F0|nr:hypothetical protein [Nocardia carnea]